MKFGIALTNLGHGELAPQIDRALQLKCRHGLNHIEISMTNLDGNPWILWPWQYTDSAISEMRDFVSQFESRGVHLPFGYNFLTCPNPRIREEAFNQLKQGVIVSAQLGLHYTVTHTKTGPQEPGQEQRQIEMFAQVFGELAELAEQHGIIFTVENGSDVGRPVDNIARIVKAANHRALQITFDTGHANFPDATRTYGSHAEFVRQESDLIANLHIHDNVGQTDDHLPIGQGNIDFDAVICALDATNYQGAWTLEYHPDFSQQIDQHIEDAMRLIDRICGRGDATRATKET